MKARVVSKVYIDAHPAAVFRYLSDLRYHQLWNPHLKKITPVKLLEPGMKYNAHSILFGMKLNGHIRVTKMEASRLLELQNDAGMLHFLVRYNLAKKDDGTLLTCHTTVSSESKAFAFAKPMAALLASRELRIDLDLLKTAVEQGLI